jgi:AcrR family transcriptional regulator
MQTEVRFPESRHLLSLREEQVRLTQQRILDTFESELLSEGYSSVSMRSVAKRAGISVPTVYRYYQNKEALLVALLDATTDEARFDPFAILASSDDPVEIVASLIKTTWDINERKPGRMKALVQALSISEAKGSAHDEGFKRLAFRAKEALAPLSFLPPEELRKLQAVIALMISPMTWYSLRFGHGLPLDVAKSIVMDTVKASIDAALTRAGDRRANGKSAGLDRSKDAIRERFEKARKEL